MIQRDYGKDDISFNALNGEFIRKYEIYLKMEKALANNTLVRYMKVFKKVTNLALADEYLKRDPFMGAKYKQDETNLTFLTKEELENILNKEFEVERLNLVKNIFLFCGGTGLAFIDAKELRPEHLKRQNPELRSGLWI